MDKKFSEIELQKQIKKFFSNINNKSSKQIKKIKKLAMKNNNPLGELRKKFCKKCFVPYGNSKVRIKDKVKSVTCGNCGYVSRWKLND